MRIGGTYVGLGEGDRSPEIVKLKALLKRKFTPARKTLDDGDLFTPELTTEVRRIQEIYTAEGKPGAPRYLVGVVNVEFKYDVGLMKRPDPVKPIIFTVEGHMSNMFFGPCAQTAGELEQEGFSHWKPVGDWDTTALPFKNVTGVEALFRQLNSAAIEGPPVDANNPDGPKIMWPFPAGTPWGIVGFSQGAMICCEFFWKYILPEDAQLHYRLKDFKRGLMFGNPRRAKDAVCWWAQSPPDPGTHGIMDKLFDAEAEGIGDRWAEHPNDDDMFAEVGDDKAGKDQTAIALIVTEGRWGGPAGLWRQVLKVFGNPFGGIYNALKAAFDAILFLATNPNPHYGTYATGPDVDWMRGVAQ